MISRALILLTMLASQGIVTGESSPPKLDPGRVAFLKGDYEEALKHSRAILSKNPTSVDAFENTLDVLVETGRYEEALKTSEEFAAGSPKEIRAYIRSGDLLSLTGKYKEAASAFRKALELSPKDIDAKFGLGYVMATTGRADESKRLVAEITENYYSRRSKEPRQLLTYGLAFMEADRPHQALDLLVQAAADLNDPAEAILATGFLFLHKAQINDAAKEFRPLLKKNPKHPIAHLGMAGCYFQDGNYPQVSTECEAALKTNPNLVEALELQAALALNAEDYAEAERYLKRAIDINPSHLSVRTRLASCFYLNSRMEDYEREEKSIFAIHPKYAEFYRSIGDAAERLRRPETAKKFFEKAYAMQPDSWKVLESLGFFYCREGREEEAYEVLERSFKFNRFNRRVFNLLQTLDYMEDFVTEESDHFTLRVHRKKDSCLSSYALRYLHGAKEDFCERYKTPVTERILVELFPRHDFFAARIHGLPGIGLNGVCFGKVILADSPGVRPNSFNWRDVLVHEFSHVVTLTATDYKIPRWLTEGLAVYDEDRQRNFDQDRMLVTAWKTGELIPLAELNRGFTRPKSHFQIMLAYMQGELAVEFLLDVFGLEKVIEMLKRFRSGDKLETISKNVLGRSLDELSKSFLEHATAIAEKLPLLPRYMPQHLKALEEAVKKNPQDPRKMEQYALALLQNGHADKAQGQAEQALKYDMNSPVAHVVMGEIHIRNKDYEVARTLYEKVIRTAPHMMGPYFRLAVVAQKQSRQVDALAQLKHSIRIYNRFPPAYSMLETLAEKTEETKTRLDALEGMLRFPATSTKAAGKLLKVYQAVDRHADVERVALKLFEVNPYSLETHDILARSYQAQDKLDGAAQEYLVCIQLSQRNIDYHLKLARVLLKNDQKPEAKRVLMEARKIDRRHAEVKALLEKLD